MKNRTTWLMALVILVSFISTSAYQLLSYRRVVREQEVHEIHELTDTLNVVNNYIDQFSDNIKTLLFSVSSMESIFTMEREEGIRTLKSIEDYNSGLVSSIFIRNDRGEVFSGNSQFIYEIMGNPGLEYIYSAGDEEINRVRFTAPYHGQTSGDTICVYRILDEWRMVAAEIDFTALEQEITRLLTVEYSSFAVYSREKELIFYDRSNGEELPGWERHKPPSISYEALLEIPGVSGAGERISRDNPLTRLTTTENDFDFEVHIVCSEELFAQSIRQAFVSAYLGTFIFILCLVVLFNMFIILFLRPVRRLGKRMRRIEQESDLREIEVTSNDEVGRLCRSYNMLIRNMRTLIRDMKQAERNKQEYELKMLRSQIGPHFLYNTLSCISSLSRQGRSQEVSRSISSLVKILSLNFDKEGESISIRQELEGIENYLFIQKMRYGDKFDLSVGVPERLMECRILKLTLQPVVENAIFHGILPGTRRGRIVIKMKEQAGNVLIFVGDNGVGIPKDYFDDILSGNLHKRINDRFSNIGLANVHQRLKLHFGEEYGIKIHSKVGMGTVIQITIPVMEEDRNINGGLKAE